MFLRSIAASLLCVFLSGCDQLTALTTPVPDKVNAAFPLPDALQVARQSLQQSLTENPAALRNSEEQFSRLMNVRALSCSATSSIGRFDTIPAIKRKIKNTDCFTKQDAELDQWVSLQRLVQIHAKPPLAPWSELAGKVPLPHSGDASNVVAAAGGANVIAVRSGQRYNVLEIPGGRQLHSIAVPELSYRPPLLSPNGRVLALPLGSRSLRMVEAETGNVLWNTEAYSGILAWLPQAKIALLTQSNTGAPYVLDLATGRIDPFPSTEKQLSWALSTPTADGRYVAGNNRTISLIDIGRDANNTLVVNLLKQWHVPAGRSIQSPTVFLMNEGKRVVYQTAQDLGWLDLTTESQGVWDVSALYPNRFAKLNEQQIIFDTTGRSNTAPTAQVLDIAQELIGTAVDIDPREGILLPLLPRSGYLHSGNSGIAIGASVQMDGARPLAAVLTDAQLAKQLTRLEQQSNGSESTSSNPYHEAIARQIRAMNAASALRDGLSHEKVEAIRRGDRYTSTEPAPAAPSGIKPLLTDIAANAQVAMVGVYESGRRSGSNRNGPVTIDVQPGNTPIVLVLSSYESVQWMVRSNGRKIEAVLLSGYSESNAYGISDVKVLKIGSNYAYKMGGREYEMLKRDVARYVANPVSSFQANYKGESFRVP